MVAIKKMELVSLGGECSFSLQVARMILDARFDILNSNKKQCQMLLRMCSLILFQFPMGTYFLEMNM
jgi:hypothetical protein